MKTLLTLVAIAPLCFLPVTDAWGRGFGGGGFHGGEAGGFHGGEAGGFHKGEAGGVHASGFSGGYGSVHYGDVSAGHYGGVGATDRSANYGSISHYDTTYHTSGEYDAWGHGVTTGEGYGAGAVHGGMGGSAAAYKGPYSSGAVVRGPAGNEAAAVKGPAGGVYGGYRGPYGGGAVEHLPSDYTATAWRGATYYHSGSNFYQPRWYGGSLYYYPVAAPVGWFFGALPAAAAATVIAGSTYYVADGVYYQPATQDGQTGYAVVEPPAQAAAPAEAQAPTEAQAPAEAQAPVEAQAPAEVQAPAAGQGPDPFAALKSMSDYLGKQDHFMAKVSTIHDEVSTAGEKIQLSAQRTIHVNRPDKLAADVTTGLGAQRRVVFDGRQVTIIDLNANAYGVIPLQGTLDTALDTMAQQYGMAQPMGDLLYSNVYDRLAPKLKSGQFLGTEDIAGNLCNHFAYTQAGMSWQIWMDQGDKPVPRKLVISYDSTPGRPQYTLLITAWDTSVQRPQEFLVSIPQGARQVSVMSLEGQIAAGR